MTGTFTFPSTCRLCGGSMKIGMIKTIRENYFYEKYPFHQLTSGELWYELEAVGDGKYIVRLPEDGPLMVFHYRCVECGYLESYAREKYP